MNFLPRIAFTAFLRFLYVVFPFSFASGYCLFSLFISSLAHWLFKSVLFNFYIFVNFSVFFLLLISSFVPLWLEKTFGMISVILHLLRLFVSCHILERVPCAPERNVCSAALGWDALHAC